jgi:hypothetical protein
MLVALGFLAASLLGLIVASAFWSRAVRLTTARIKQSMPVSEPEIRADRDRLRAEYAIKVHKLEMELDQAKLARARQIIDINRRDASIATLESSVTALKADLEENQNARRVLEQTVADRLPRVEARLAEARRVLFNRDREIAELAAAAKRSKQALEEATSLNAQKTAQIERLTTLAGKGSRASSGDASDGEGALRAEIDMLRGKVSEQALLIDRLQRRLGHGQALASPAKGVPPDSPTERFRKDIAEAEAALDQVRSASGAGEAGSAVHERQIRALTAKTEDQAGEIARLKAALAAFEQEGISTGLKDSKIALKARLGSAQARADQQATTIAKLRAELAATHERLAKQAAHFMGEMRRIGGATGASQPRRPVLGDDRRLVDRVAQVRAPPTRALPQPVLAESAAEAEPAGHANGHNGNSKAGTASADAAAMTPPSTAVIEEAAQPSSRSEPDPVAPEMPQPSGIPEKRRRPRLLDRITGVTKG